MIYLFGRSDQEILGYMLEQGIKFVRGVTIFITNLNWQKGNDLRLESTDRVVVLSGTSVDRVESLVKLAVAQNYNLGGRK